MGIGQQLADDFAMLGANLVLTGTEEKEIQALNAKTKKRKGAFTKYYAVDFTNSQSIDTFLGELNFLKRIDVCVNNAGTNATSAIDEARIEDWRNIMAVNLEAPFKITRAVSRL